LRRALGEGLLGDRGGPGREDYGQGRPIEGAHKNGRTYLRACLESHRPIDLMTIMLGTNDLKARFAASPPT
jgi:lysophospholipase L1-like esterase